MNSSKNNNDIKQKEEDQLVIFVCADLQYKDINIYKFLDEIYNSSPLYENFKINPDSKQKIAKIFYKYQDPNNINKEEVNLGKNNLEFGALNEFTSLDIDSIDEKNISKMNKGRVSVEVTKMRKWKNLKCVFLFINIIMIILTVLLFYYLLGKS